MADMAHGITGVPLPQKVAEELRAEMGRQQKSVTEMAQALGMDRGVTKERYDGKRSLTLSEVDTLADWLEVDRDQLLGAASTAVAS